MTIPKKYRGTRERILTNFDFRDIATGLGYVTFNASKIEENDFSFYVIDENLLNTSSTDGLVDAGTYDFETSTFNLSQKIKGNAYLSGFVDFSSNCTITATISKILYETIGKGAIEQQDSSEESNSTTTPTIVQTLTMSDQRVFEATVEIKNDGGGTGNTTFTKMLFTYSDGQTDEHSQQSNNTGTYVTKTFTNKYPKKRVDKIDIYLYRNASVFTAFLQNSIAYAVTGITETIISSAIASKTKTADSPFTLRIPLTKTKILNGENLNTKVVITGGKVVVDPKANISTFPSLILFLPTEIRI